MVHPVRAVKACICYKRVLRSGHTRRGGGLGGAMDPSHQLRAYLKDHAMTYVKTWQSTVEFLFRRVIQHFSKLNKVKV